MYSDKEFMMSGDMVRESMCPVNLELFCSRAKQSKNNQVMIHVFTDTRSMVAPASTSLLFSVLFKCIRDYLT